MAELQTKVDTAAAPAPVAPVKPEPPLAEAPPQLAAGEKKAVAPPPEPPAAAVEETKALAVVESESEFVFFRFSYFFLQ